MKKIYLFFLIFKLTFSYINIHPTTFDKPIDNDGSYQEFTLFNQSSAPILYRIYSEPDPENLDRSMHRWMNFYPKTITLKPGEMGKIQLNIASHSKLEIGEYSAVLGVREIPIYEEVIKGNGANVSIYTDLKMVLTGYAGNASPKLKLNDLKILENGEKVKLHGSVENLGERRGKFEIYLGNNFLGNIRVMSKEKLKFHDFDFSFKRKDKEKISNVLIFKDYESKKIIGKIKI